MNNVITGVSNMKSHIIFEILHVLKKMKHGNNMFVDIGYSKFIVKTPDQTSICVTRWTPLLVGHDAASVM